MEIERNTAAEEIANFLRHSLPQQAAVKMPPAPPPVPKEVSHGTITGNLQGFSVTRTAKGALISAFGQNGSAQKEIESCDLELAIKMLPETLQELQGKLGAEEPPYWKFV